MRHSFARLALIGANDQGRGCDTMMVAAGQGFPALLPARIRQFFFNKCTGLVFRGSFRADPVQRFNLFRR